MTSGTDRWRKSSYSTFQGHCLEAAYRKSSRSISGGACLEAAWRKSAHSMSNGHCAGAAARDGAVLVRDSKLGDASPVLGFSPAAWREFTEGIKAA